MKKQTCFLLVLILFSCYTFALNDSINYEIKAAGVLSSGPNSAFWLRSDSYGIIPYAPNSAIVLTGISKDFTKNSNPFQYAFKANVVFVSNDKKNTLNFHEIYAHARFRMLDFSVGARREIIGNQDSTLSSGGILFSKNARPIPKITIGIERFTDIPFSAGYLQIKGALSHGWFTDNTYAENVLLHHKYAYLRLGGKLPVHIQYGLDHAAQWGGNIPGWGIQPISFKNYKSIFFGKSGGSDANISDQINALGNHIISQSIKVEFDISGFTINSYWQNISEDGPIRPIWNTMNIVDGLWGISVRNRNFPLIRGIVYEYLNTTDQSGPYHDKDGIVYGGSDGYFSGQYQSGWSYFSKTIGTPFILAPRYNETTQNYHPYNNRVQVHHLGIEGEISGYKYKALSSFSKNYGTYAAPLNIKNTSILCELYKNFPRLLNVEIGASLAADFGKLYGNSVGCMISIKKSGNLFNY